ncbi:MAG: universal stress protein [Acidobacteriia bacterium]|nr:universal stress protein [Terriglobia bacterium]
MKILLAVDSSAQSDRAVAIVADRPWPPNTTVEVLSVVEPLYAWDVPSLMETLNQMADESVQAAAQQLRSSGIQPTTLVSCGDAKAAIVDRAREMGADLVVVGSHGVTSVRRFLLGSVARAVLRSAPCSVEIVRAEAVPGAMKILLATDGSQCSEAAARSIAERPWPSGTKVRILSVAEHPIRLPAAADRHRLDPAAMKKLEEAAIERAQGAVRSAEKIIREGSLPASGTAAAPSATPKEIILQEAAECGAHLIVVGSHGRRGIDRFLIGSVSEAVAIHALCSVEVIRHSQ